MQGAEQEIKEFVAELRVLASHRDFGATMDLMLRDRFVCGVHDQVLQKRLLSEEDAMTFEKAQKIALAVETAAKSSCQLTGELPARDSQEVHRVETHNFISTAPSWGRRQKPPLPSQNRYVSTQGNCYRCGGNHSPQICRFKKYRCHSCGGLGHLSRKCKDNDREKHQFTAANRVDDAAAVDSDVHGVEEESEVCGIYMVGRPKTPPITAEVTVYDVPVTFEVDTGAVSTLMTMETFEAVRTIGGDIGV